MAPHDFVDASLKNLNVYRGCHTQRIENIEKRQA